MTERSRPRLVTRRCWITQAIGLGSAFGLSGCYQAHVIVRVSGVPESTWRLQLRAALGAQRAVELYPPEVTELSFYLPAASEGQSMTLTVSALDAQQAVLARGSAEISRIGSEISYSLDIVLL